MCQPDRHAINYGQIAAWLEETPDSAIHDTKTLRACQEQLAILRGEEPTEVAPEDTSGERCLEGFRSWQGKGLHT